jgi:hypothetical protein
MGFPFRRRESSPRSDDGYPEANGSDGDSRWKSSNGRKGLDAKRLATIGGGMVGVVLVIVLLSKLLGGNGGRKDPFEITERTPTTK